MSTVLIDRDRAGVAVLTLNRPEKLNAMDVNLVTDLKAALAEVGGDRACRAIVVTGAGRGFCAGLDLAGYGPAPDSEGRGAVGAGFATQQHIASLIPQLRSLHQPVIAAINGAAAGGGLALALGSDIRIAASSARFNVAFVRIGLSGCDIGVSWLLPRLVGASRAWEMMLTGRIVESAEAERMGLVSRVVPDGEVVDAALETAAQVAANSPWGVRMTKEVAWSQLEVGSLQAGIDLENRTQVMTSFTQDMGEAMAAFLEKRPPEFRDR
jgi:enoyl-CoA hydratase